MGEEVCLALHQALSNDSDMLQAISLDSNGLTDHRGAIILDGLSKQSQLRYVMWKRNQISTQSANILAKMVTFKQPKNLKELKIISCKISDTLLDSFLSKISDSSLRRLALVDLNLNKKQLDSISALVSNSNQLVELDISWNKVDPKSMGKLFEGLKVNRYLEILNLSWNRIQHGKKELTEED
jgi:Ran GTPase-activating protein (RanGAP) involved in mRNA processing and transport